METCSDFLVIVSDVCPCCPKQRLETKRLRMVIDDFIFYEFRFLFAPFDGGTCRASNIIL